MRMVLPYSEKCIRTFYQLQAEVEELLRQVKLFISKKSSRLPIHMQVQNPWLLIFKSKIPTRLRLFCFPHAGAGASVFRTWCNELPPDVEVCAVQLPGREARLKEPPFTNLDLLIQALTQQLLPYLDVPFAFFGHSLGALISFELARSLRRQQAPTPVFLFVSGRRPPQHLKPAAKLPNFQLPDDALIDQIRRFGGTPNVVLEDPELKALFVPLLRADMALIGTYAYTPELPLECPISVFGGLQDLSVKKEELLDWRNQTKSAFVLRLLSGDHFFIKPQQPALLKFISEDIGQTLLTNSQLASV